MNPLVTVNILSFNRKDELRITLAKVFEQDYKNIEVIVVDNASTDGTQVMVQKEFPSVIIIELKENIGIAGWNKGFEIARGEYVLVLDDDSYPLDYSIKNAVKRIKKEEKIGVVACAIENEKWGSFENPEYQTYNLLTFTGCGALINSKILDKTGYFQELLFIYLHELEFSIRVIESGYKIVFEPSAHIIHNYSDINRGDYISYRYDRRKDFFFFRNRIIIYFLHFTISLKSISFYLLILKMLLKSIPQKLFKTKIQAFKSVFELRNKIKSLRKPISLQTQELYYKHHF